MPGLVVRPVVLQMPARTSRAATDLVQPAYESGFGDFIPLEVREPHLQIQQAPTSLAEAGILRECRRENPLAPVPGFRLRRCEQSPLRRLRRGFESFNGLDERVRIPQCGEAADDAVEPGVQGPRCRAQRIGTESEAGAGKPHVLACLMDTGMSGESAPGEAGLRPLQLFGDKCAEPNACRLRGFGRCGHAHAAAARARLDTPAFPNEPHHVTSKRPGKSKCPIGEPIIG